MRRLKKRTDADVAQRATSGGGPDFSMMCMLAGAACKFMELLIVREGVLRYQYATLGGILIVIGSTSVTLNALYSVYQHLRGQVSDVEVQLEASSS